MIAFTIILLIVFAGGILGWRHDVKSWNKGRCTCGGEWHYFDTDSQGGRGYDCSSCHRVIWISWIGEDR